MATFLVQLRRTGPEWNPDLPLREQPRFVDHAAFIDRLVHEERLILVGGPLADEERVVYLVRADSEDEARERVVEADPWSGSHLVLEAIDGWTLLLDSIGVTDR
jgi:hypothetical protein